MTGLPILLSRQKSSFIPIEASKQVVARYFRSTKRAVDSLFGQKGFEDLGKGFYRYIGSPFPIAWWEVVPSLFFHVEQTPEACQDGVDLKLVLDSCQLAGDQGWSVVADNISFDCETIFTSQTGGFEAKASALVKVNHSSWLRMVPAAVIRELAIPVIDWILDRVLLRCKKSMRKDIEHWLATCSLAASC